MSVKHRLDLHFSKRKGTAILIASIFIILIGLFIMLNPPTYVTTETIDQRVYSIDVNHQSTTVKNSRLYNEGYIVSNGPQYFMDIHPELIMRFSEDYEGNYTANILHTNSTIKAISTRGKKVIWSEQKRIQDTTWAENIDESTVKINTIKLSNEINEINNEIPNSADITVEFEYTYEFTTEKDDLVTLTSSPTLRFNSRSSYEIDSEQVTTTRKTTEDITKPQPSQSTTILGNTLGIYGLVIISVGLVISLVGIYILYGGIYSTRTYNERLYTYHQAKYDEWITYGRPMADPEYESVWEKLKVDTLEGLVDVAIDTDKRVIYSKDMSRFYIFSDGTLYTYLPPNTDEDASQYGFF